jgi:hypothetical protein
MSSSGSGLVNSVVAANVATTVAEFSPLSDLFNEFFIKDFELKWVPAFMNTGLIGTSLTGATTLNLPIGLAAYHHGAVLPSSLAALSTNPTCLYVSSGEPFTYRWRNVEDPNSRVLVASTPTTATPTQGWCLTAATPAEAYTGQVLIISNSSPTMAPSTVLGTFLFTANVLFRTRV